MQCLLWIGLITLSSLAQAGGDISGIWQEQVSANNVNAHFYSIFKTSSNQKPELLIVDLTALETDRNLANAVFSGAANNAFATLDNLAQSAQALEIFSSAPDTTTLYVRLTDKASSASNQAVVYKMLKKLF